METTEHICPNGFEQCDGDKTLCHECALAALDRQADLILDLRARIAKLESVLDGCCANETCMYHVRNPNPLLNHEGIHTCYCRAENDCSGFKKY